MSWSKHFISSMAIRYYKCILRKIWETKLFDKCIYNSKRVIHDGSKIINQYVIFAKSFYDSYITATFRKCDLSFDLYSVKVQEFSEASGFIPYKRNSCNLKSFFDKAKELWETKLLTINSDGDEINELIRVLRYIVASELWELNVDTKIPFNQVSISILELSTESTYEEYIKRYKSKFGDLWNNHYAMEQFVFEFYSYNQWCIDDINIDNFKQYSLDNTLFPRIKTIINYLLSWFMEQYIKVDEYLYFSNDNYSSVSTNFQTPHDYCIKYCKEDSKTYLCGVKEFIFKTLKLEIPLNFTITNTLRLFGMGEFLGSKFCDGIFIIYTKGTNMTTIFIDLIKNPKKLLEKLAKNFNNMKVTVVDRKSVV